MKKVAFIIALVLVWVAGMCQTEMVDTADIQSKIFNSTRRIKIVVPADYNSNPDQTYIVAFLFDAQSNDFFNYYKTTISYLTNMGYVKPLILVGIASENRQYEFTPVPETEAGVKDFRKSGGATLLAQHLENEVLPYLKTKYRCSNYTIGIGHSLGATFVSYCMLNYPQLFNAGIAVSPNFVFDQQQLVHKFDSIPNVGVLNHKFFYLAHGQGDYLEDKFKDATDKVGNMLTAKNIPGLTLLFKTLDNNSHGTTPMEGVFKAFMALYGQFTIPDKLIDSFYKDTRTSFIVNVKQYYSRVSARLGIQLPLVHDINNMGYNCFYSNKKQEAVDVFDWGLTLYPDNINLYDSRGEIEQNIGNKQEALESYTKGLEVVKKQKNKLDATTYANLVQGFENRLKSLNK
jgi:predicted alpha/beta superfamily hydrolase